MARTIDDIQQQIITNVQATPELAGATSTSKRAIWRLWTYVVAVAINLFEQLQDVFLAQSESIVALSAPQTAQWVQDRAFKFQYDATNPQVIQLIDLVPQYPVVNPDLRIVTRCSVRSTGSGRVQVKVAKSDPPEALDGLQLAALQSYMSLIGVAGIAYNCTTAAPDKLYVAASIYYKGGYSAIISGTVIAAIEAYFAAIPFDGNMKLLDLEIAIKNVPGVNDVVFQNVSARYDSTPYGTGTYLVQNNTVISRQWATVAGYIVGETTTGATLADTLTFIPE